jgi:hypothetical protein
MEKFDLGNTIKFISESLDHMSQDDIEKFFPREIKPKGWLSIEEYLPMFMAIDITNGYSIYRVKYSDGTIGESRVVDHNIWYYDAKEAGITHWYNE